jgi:thioesterase domain-containing protein
MNLKNNGKVIIYGYSWGGDTAVELAKDLKAKQINVELLITIDSALGPFNGPAVRDRTIPTNVKMKINHYTTTPKSRIGSRGLSNKAEDSSKTKVINISHTGPTHGQMDEETLSDSVNYILDVIVGDRVCD